MEPIRLYPLAVVPREPQPTLASLWLLTLASAFRLCAVLLGFAADIFIVAGDTAEDMAEGGHG